jgi:hypothetical protein
MKLKSLRILSLTACALSAAAVNSTAQDQAAAPATRTVYIWDSANTGTARTGTWGGGAVERGRAGGFDGGAVLQITTHNFYEGARFDLGAPVDLSTYQQNGFIRMRVRLRAPRARVAGAEGFPSGGFPGAGFPGAFPGAGGPPGAFPGGGPGGFLEARLVAFRVLVVLPVGQWLYPAQTLVPAMCLPATRKSVMALARAKMMSLP